MQRSGTISRAGGAHSNDGTPGAGPSGPGTMATIAGGHIPAAAGPRPGPALGSPLTHHALLAVASRGRRGGGGGRDRDRYGTGAGIWGIGNGGR
jgi:hypothetical protein